MPADREYLERFYEKSPDSPREQLSKEEFLANVNYFYAKLPFAKVLEELCYHRRRAFTADELKEYNKERAKKGNVLYGWDNLGAEIVKGIGKELEYYKQSAKETGMREAILNGLDSLGKLISADFGRPPQSRRISEKVLADVCSQLWEERNTSYGGWPLPGALNQIRTEIIQMGIQEYIEGVALPPNWENGYILMPEPDNEGFVFEPPYVDFLINQNAVDRGVWRIDWEPFHQVTVDRFAGKKFNPHFGDFKFYRLDEILQKVKITRNTTVVFDTAGKYRILQFDPRMRTFVTKKGEVVSTPMPTHHIIAGYYQNIASTVLGKKGVGSFKAMCERVKLSLADRRKRIRRKFEWGIKSPRLAPSGVIFSSQGGYPNYAICFGHLMAWMVQCGILKMGEYVKEADIYSAPPILASHVQIACKNMGTHILVRLRWLDPTFLPSPKGARMFLLLGLAVKAHGRVKLPRWKHKGVYGVSNIFLAFEIPTSGALELPILGKDMPLYDEEFYPLMQEGKIKALDISPQFYTLYQRSSDLAIVPAASASSMPTATIFFGTPASPPNFTQTGEF